MATLTEDRLTQLDGIVSSMEAAGEPEENIRFVVDDFQNLYGAGQSPAATAGNALVSGAVDLLAKPFQALRNVQTTVGDLGQKYGGAPGRMLADTVTGGISNPLVTQFAADQATNLRAATQEAFPVDSERNPIAATIGGVVPQVAGMIGAGMALGPAAGLALMAPSEAQAGFEMADEVGLTSPEARLGMAGGFAGLGTYIERLGGIGAKQAVGSLVKRGLKGALSETLEEPATGAAQDLLTAAIGSTVLDPNNAGYTVEGYDLSQLDPRSPAYLKKRGLEALGGAVGGTLFAGVNALASRGQPAPGQPPPLPPSDFSGTAPAPISPLSGIAQRAGRVDVPPLVPGDLGPLTAADVADLETPPAQPPPLPQVSPYAPPVPPSASVTQGPQPTAVSLMAPPELVAGSTPAAGALSPETSVATTEDSSVVQPAALAPAMETVPTVAEPVTSTLTDPTGAVEPASPQEVAIQKTQHTGVWNPITKKVQQLGKSAGGTDFTKMEDGNGNVYIQPDGGKSLTVYTPQGASVEIGLDTNNRPYIAVEGSRSQLGEYGGFEQGGQFFLNTEQAAKTLKQKLGNNAPELLDRITPEQAPPTPRALTNLNPSGSTVVAVRNDGSTIIFNELIDLAARAVQRGVTFAQWAADTVRRLGASVRDYLESAWQAATTRTMPRMGGGRITVRRPEGGFIPSPLHRQGEAFRVKNQILRARLTGSPLPKGFTQVLDATDNQRRAVDQTAAMIGQDLQVAVEAYAKRTGTPLANVWTLVEPVMTGQPGALAGLNMLDANLAERARRARNNLDDLSQAVAQTMPAGDLRDAILGNVGQWMRRGYAAFDPESDWSFDKVTAAAKAGKLIAGKDARLILSNARAYLRAQNPTATVAEIEADMRDLMDRNTWQAALLGGTVKKAVGSLMRRKDIAPEIRALMGEETNPLHRYLQSAKFQAQLIARHHGQVAMRTIGLATGLLQPARGGVYTVEIPKEGHLWSGLGGTWTTPELMQAMENSSGILQDGNTWGGWLVKTLKVLGNEAKLNRVALNPDSWMVNVLGGFMSTVQSGDVFATSFIRRMRDAGGYTGSGASTQGLPFRRKPIVANALQDAQREMLARLTEQGVIGSTLTLADIEASIPRHLLQWVAENQARDRALGAAQGAMMGQAMGRGLGLTGRVIGGAIGGVGGALAGTQNLQKWRQKVAEWTMTKPDNLFRVTGWLTNYETALASGMQPDPAAQWASERTLNTYPNYNALPAVLREFSKLGLVGSFIAFQHEVYRNTYWNIRYAVREVGSGNAAMQARGLQRLAGLTSIAALTFGGGLAAALSMTGAAGADDERNRLFRKWFGAPWEKDAVLAFDQFSPTSVSYFNTSYLLPQITLQELAQAASEGADEGKTVQRVMGRLWEQFAGTSVHLGPIMAAMMNMDRTGRKITNRPGVVGALERVDSALTTIAEPGFAEKMTRIAYALRPGQPERRGRKFSVKQELLRFIGVRGTERTWDTLVKGRYSRFGGEYQGIRDDANRMLGENLPGAQVQAIEEANARIAELDAQRVEFEAAMNKMGIDPTVIRAAKKDSAFSALNPVKVRRDGKRVESAVRR